MEGPQVQHIGKDPAKMDSRTHLPSDDHAHDEERLEQTTGHDIASVLKIDFNRKPGGESKEASAYYHLGRGSWRPATRGTDTNESLQVTQTTERQATPSAPKINPRLAS